MARILLLVAGAAFHCRGLLHGTVLWVLFGHVNKAISILDPAFSEVILLRRGEASERIRWLEELPL